MGGLGYDPALSVSCRFFEADGIASGAFREGHVVKETKCEALAAVLGRAILTAG
jgi:hypothetical protein